ncbi:N-acetylneuraminate synthase [Synechococcus sp. A10-1-5-1]|uniref:N-acetylneuraminate synthase n=1 Tax=Synechococcus sp. A10-1-5-1 TaxID=2936507 RepID=UPI002000A0A6|nr:N-acetylneuraminate synthase [Synechococcus sp. A10-1-5-1]UPM49286.1 N-acetylneuraminate synthase [Synechococcus sp. A10-1-5-1]
MATLVIAEAGVNHNGDLALAKQLVDAAVAAGADAVKFQTFSAADLVTASAPKADYQTSNDGAGGQREMLERLELSPAQHRELAAYCRNCGISFLSTAFGIPELELLLELGIGAIKVPSGEITHRPLLEGMATAAASRHLPVYLSTGMSTLGEVEAALEVFLEAGVPRGAVTLMHCLSAYPAPEEQINLRALSSLAVAFGCPVGYSDHTLGLTAPVAATALGAMVIEKHLTLDVSLPGPDHRASLEPEPFAAMVAAIRSCERMLGDGRKQPQLAEENTRQVARRSLRAARFIAAGQPFLPDDLICQRPADGLSPMSYPHVLGRQAHRSYKPGEAIDG